MDIDIVIAWVDGSDPAWQAEKRQYQPNVTDENSSVNRFRDWGLLPYWFRGIETFAPWVRTIHFLTWGHVPAFLNLEAPKLHIVRHEEFIPAEHRPTFSSHAIEANLRSIPGLAERFIYFNDDMFLVRPMPESAFFRDGLPCTYGGEVPISFREKVGLWQYASVNNLALINRHFLKKEQVRKFGKKYRNSAYRWKDNLRTLALEKLFPESFLGFKNIHAPGAYLKSCLDEVWQAEPEMMRHASANRFRCNEDVNQWVYLWWQVASGKFAPFNTDNYVNSVTEETAPIFERIITGQTHDMVCINDPDGEIDFERLSERMKQAFEKILPNKSAFEK